MNRTKDNKDFIDEYLKLDSISNIKSNLYSFLYISNLFLAFIWIFNIENIKDISISLIVAIILTAFVFILDIWTLILIIKPTKIKLYYLYCGFMCYVNSLISLNLSILILYYINYLYKVYMIIAFFIVHILNLLFFLFANKYMVDKGIYYSINKKTHSKGYGILLILTGISFLVLSVVYGVCGALNETGQPLIVSITTFILSLITEMGVHNIYKYYLLKKLNVDVSPIIQTYYETKKKNKKNSKLDDKQANKLLKKILSNEKVDSFKDIDINLRDNYIISFKEKGMSMKKISELTGLSYYMVRKICNNNN